MRRRINPQLQKPLPQFDPESSFSRATNIESALPQDLSRIYQISPEYHGPVVFQCHKRINNHNLYPYQDNPRVNWNHSGISINNYPVSFSVRYDKKENPVTEEISGFVANHPYPHEIAPLEHRDTYDNALYAYQQRVYDELSFHIEQALTLADQHPEYGTPVFPLAFNGAKPVGHLLTEKFKIPTAQLFTSQVKRIPLADGGLVIAAGGIELPEAVKDGQTIFPIFLDDCLATWSTQRFLKELLVDTNAPISAQFYGAVVGTRHPFMREFINAQMPTYVSLSAPCFNLGDNAYLLNCDGSMQVGDMGKIINTEIAGNGCQHQQWGSGTQAHLQYQ